MLDQSLLQSHFIGRDGFRWWIGQIPELKAFKANVEVSDTSWGNRFKVRIFGYHPYNPNELKDEDLPWAQVLLPTTSGSGASNCLTGVQLQPGDIVFGFFLDGDDAQIPVILATFGNTTQRPSTEFKSPFVSFTGYSDFIQPIEKPNETSEINSKAPDVAQPTPPTLPGPNGINNAIGEIIPLANTVKNTQIEKIKSVVQNLIRKLKNITKDVGDYKKLIDQAVDSIVSKANDLVGGLFQTLVYGSKDGGFPGLIEILKQGLELLYKLVYGQILAATGNPVAAHLGGVAAQKAMVIPVKKLELAFSCVLGSVMNSLKSVVFDILDSVISNVDRFVTCAAEQFAGTFLNSIINSMELFMDGPLELVSKLLQFFSDFSVGNLLRSGINTLTDAVVGFACNQNLDSYTDLVNKWVIGYGPVANTIATYDSVKEIVNNINNGSQSTIDCFTGALKFASPPTITIFGGRGSGATAVPIFGNITKNSSGNLIGSIIGVRVTNSGSGYAFPPFVEISDDNDQGYGAIARSVTNEKGEVTSIYIVSEGENYSIGDISQYSILDVYVESGGEGYEDAEVVDNLGNNYNYKLINGSISQVKPLNNIIDTFPVLRVKSDTGSGAILRPILGDFNMTTTKQKSIDCPI